MARIRTIKPEFWCHPVLGKQDDATKLMAIALLNYADDEGYFHAEPNLVRGFCRPFDDNSTITRKCLENLSKIGYISICENSIYGAIGVVEKFSEHQKIDRSMPSKLKQYYSSNPRRILDEPSLLEGKGKERNRERKEKEYAPEILELKEFCKGFFDKKYVTDKCLGMFQKLKDDGYEVRRIKEIIQVTTSDPFWSKNFVSPLKLADKDKNNVTYIDRFDKQFPESQSQKTAKKQEVSTFDLFNQA